MAKRQLSFGVIGAGLMGREFASAAARWCHLLDLDFEPRIVAVADPNAKARAWFEDNVASVVASTEDYRALLDRTDVDAVYAAVPHDLHERVYLDVIEAGKHLLGEKPFGIDLGANASISAMVSRHPEVLVRCASEFPFFPGAHQISRWVAEGRFGRIIEVEAGFWHSSDLDPNKPINWKRRHATNGEYGCLGDLGMHVCHLPLRYGFTPTNVRALLSKIVSERPDSNGRPQPCETWDNAILACEAEHSGERFPMLLSTKRIAPGHQNTWFIRIAGTAMSAEYSTKETKRLAYLPYAPGGPQEWHVTDVAYRSAYPAITGGIFEFGFSDSILQMWAAFCDEVVHGSEMRQPFRCATPEEASMTHRLFTAALKSQAQSAVVRV